MRLAGRRALLIGGHKNLGLSLAKRFLAEGAQVAVVGRDAAGVESAQKALAGQGGKSHALVGDPASQEGARAVIAAASERLGGPADVLVNAAGTYVWKPFLEVTAADWQK